MELLQLSTPWCPPCKMAKEYIERNFDVDFIGYKFILINEQNSLNDRDLEIVKKLKPRGVPMFVVIEGSEIIYTFNGFNLDEINKYVDYVTKQNTSTIKDSVSIEDINKRDTLYADIVDEIENKRNMSVEDFLKETGDYDEDYLDDRSNDNHVDDRDDAYDDDIDED